MPTSLNCLGLPVFTQGGIYLGRIVGVEVETTAAHVVYYQIKKAPRWLGLGKPDFLISPRQVISLNSEKMIVQDAIKKQTHLEGELMVESTA